MKAAESVVKLLGETRGSHLDAKTTHAFKPKCVTAGSKFEEKVTVRIGGRALNQLLLGIEANFGKSQRFRIFRRYAVDDAVLP